MFEVKTWTLGQRLGEAPSQPRQPLARAPAQQSREHGHSTAQAQAAAAAMARMEVKKKQPMSATERKARQELQQANKMAKDMENEAQFISQLQAPEEKQIEMGGIYYECPITGQIVAKSHYYEHLEQALDQLKGDAPLETAILKINCLNKNKGQFKEYLDTLQL